MKKLISILAIALAFAASWAFDWPQKETAADSFYSYFGQLRGGTISTSLIFNDISEIKAVDDGTAIGRIREHNNDFGWFESPLGNAVLIEHKDKLVTIYANLDEESLTELPDGELKQGTILGKSGNSGWQEGLSCLEFQVLDVKNSNAVNPRILMPRTGTELPLYISNVQLKDDRDVYHNPAVEKRLPAGTYSIYKDRQPIAVPFRTNVLINGATVETIQYETLKENNGHLSASGNRNYSVEELYPDTKKELLARIPLTPGKITLSITVTNILKESKTASYLLEIY